MPEFGSKSSTFNQGNPHPFLLELVDFDPDFSYTFLSIKKGGRFLGVDRSIFVDMPIRESEALHS